MSIPMGLRSALVLCWFIAFAVATEALLCAPAAAQGRVALVVGNSAYRSVPALQNPPNDASDIAGSLQRLGFSVRTLTDASFDDLRRALIDFGEEARGADMAVVFFAGHGIEVGGENWLIPVDAQLRSDIDVENEAIGLKSLMLAVSGAKELGLVILDACRNNPFGPQMQHTNRVRAVSRGLAPIEPADNVLVAFAAKGGTTAKDGAGRNSPFTTALLKHLETPGLEINFLFRNVRDDVLAATDGEQQPFVYGSLSSEAIYLKPLAAGEPTVAQRPNMPAADEIAWSFLAQTTDVATLRRFVSQFPSSRWQTQAMDRVAALEAAAARPSTPAPVSPAPQSPAGATPADLTPAPSKDAAEATDVDALARLFANNAPQIEAAWAVLKMSTDTAVLSRFADRFPSSRRKVLIKALGGGDVGMLRALRSDQMHAVLSEYGNFVQHPRYGEVWTPTVTPPGWHPYEPCHWVNAKKFGWYYLDKTPWGAIVHHYGRWAHDANVGWLWVPGIDFSPGWVLWRTSSEKIGWAPMPPVEDFRAKSVDEFNTADFWTFMDVATFAEGCAPTNIAPAAQISGLLQSTRFVRELKNAAGIVVVVLPEYVGGEAVEIDVAFDPWPSWFASQILVDWNWAWTHVDAAIAAGCPPLPPLVSPAAVTKVPAPYLGPLPPEPAPPPSPGPMPPIVVQPPAPLPVPSRPRPPPPVVDLPPAPLPVPSRPPPVCPAGTELSLGQCVAAQGPSGGSRCRPGLYYRPGTRCGRPIATPHPAADLCSGLSMNARRRCERPIPGSTPRGRCAGLSGRFLQRCQEQLGGPVTIFPGRAHGPLTPLPPVFIRPGFPQRGLRDGDQFPGGVIGRPYPPL